MLFIATMGSRIANEGQGRHVLDIDSWTRLVSVCVLIFWFAFDLAISRAANMPYHVGHCLTVVRIYVYLCMGKLCFVGGYH